MAGARAAHVTEAVELGDVEFTVAVVVRQPELLLAVGFLAGALVSLESADGVILGAERHIRKVLAVLEVQVVLLVAIGALVT